MQTVATLDSVLTTANETFRTEQKKLLATLKDPTKQIGEMRKALTETEAEQKQIFRETVQAEFTAVRAKVNAVVTAAPPADFTATLEAIKATGNAVTEYETAAIIAKYKDNYLAVRTLAEVLHQGGKAKDIRVVYPDAIVEEIEVAENLVMNWVTNYKGASYMTALLLNHTNPITALEEKVQRFLDGEYAQ